MKTAIYARVSTNNGQDPEMQLRELREYCQRRGWELKDEYVDAGISGAKDSRPELNRMLADAHRRRFDAVVVWKFDRFARSVSHLLRALETFRSLGIEFVSLSEQMDTSTPAGKMVFTVLAAVAELERRAPDKKTFVVTSEEGSAPIRHLALYLFEGKVWIDVQDYAVVRIEGHPAKKLSFWIERADFVRQYQKIGRFWLPQRDETFVQVRLYGKNVLTIDHQDYVVNPVIDKYESVQNVGNF
jgi:hypothetical protein